MHSFDISVRVYAIILRAIWLLYWKVTERKADKEKPKTLRIKLFSMRRVMRWGIYFVSVFQVLQLFGLITIFPIYTHKLAIQIGGVIITGLGFYIGVRARRVLGTNWANAHEYQIKQKHELITEDIYRYIRHPIYTGLGLFLIGNEMIVASYLFIPALFTLVAAYFQGKNEEKILLNRFGKSYSSYMKQTKMFIPFIW